MPTLFVRAKKLGGMDKFAVRATLEPEHEIIRNSSVVELKPLLSAEYFLMCNVVGISALSSFHVCGLQIVNEEGVKFSGAQTLSEHGTRTSKVMIFLSKSKLSKDPTSEWNSR